MAGSCLQPTVQAVWKVAEAYEESAYQRFRSSKRHWKQKRNTVEGAQDSYYVHLVDSQVAAACLVKGRSSSWQLNWLLRQSLVTHLSHGCKPFYGYIRSQFNPGDDPTRGVVVREPVVEEAAWLTRLKEGEPGGMDDFFGFYWVGASADGWSP